MCVMTDAKQTFADSRHTSIKGVRHGGKITGDEKQLSLPYGAYVIFMLVEDRVARVGVYTKKYFNIVASNGRLPYRENAIWRTYVAIDTDDCDDAVREAINSAKEFVTELGRRENDEAQKATKRAGRVEKMMTAFRDAGGKPISAE